MHSLSQTHFIHSSLAIQMIGPLSTLLTTYLETWGVHFVLEWSDLFFNFVIQPRKQKNANSDWLIFGRGEGPGFCCHLCHAMNYLQTPLILWTSQDTQDDPDAVWTNSNTFANTHLGQCAVSVLFTNNLLILYKLPQLGFKCTNEPEQCNL